MNKIFLLPFLLLILAACNSPKPVKPKQFRNVSGPERQDVRCWKGKPGTQFITGKLPEDLWVITTGSWNTDEMIDSAMTRLLKRVAGDGDYQPELLVSKAVLEDGKLLNDGHVRKINYTTRLLQSGDETDKFVSIGMEVLSFVGFIGARKNERSCGYIMTLPDGSTQPIRVGGLDASISSRTTSSAKTSSGSSTISTIRNRKGLSHTGYVCLKLYVMSEDGKYAEERFSERSVVVIFDDFDPKLRAL
jgi:hypothetical protein